MTDSAIFEEAAVAVWNYSGRIELPGNLLERESYLRFFGMEEKEALIFWSGKTFLGSIYFVLFNFWSGSGEKDVYFHGLSECVLDGHSERQNCAGLLVN